MRQSITVLPKPDSEPIFKIAEFQRSLWEIIRMNARFPQTPAPRAGVQRPIGRFALTSRPPVTVLL